MSVLQAVKRPQVAFDVTNKEHRKLYAEFLKSGTWGRCPFAFYIPNNDAANNNLAYAMQRLLTEFYIGKEFA